MQKCFIKQVSVKLYRDLFYVFAFAFVAKPSVLKVRANQHQFKAIYFMNMISYDPLGMLCFNR